MYTKEQLLSQLNTFKSAVGKPVLVHSSLRSVGAVEGGGEAILDVLKEFFTQNNGLLCVPTHTWAWDTMDLRKAESCIGTMPRLAAARDDGIRSMNPTHSMMVFGDGAQDFVACELSASSPIAPDSCYGKLFEEDGYVLLLGVGHESNTYLHCVEEMLGVPGRMTQEKVARYIIDRNGNKHTRYIHWFDDSKIEDPSLYFGKYEPAFRYHGAICDGKLGDASVQLCSARKMYEVMALVRRRTNGAELLCDHTPLPVSSYETRKGETL